MALVSAQVNKLVNTAATALGYEWVGCELLQNGRSSTLRVYIDSPKGIGVGDCAKVSRQISAALDVEDLIVGHYLLEVSSPGLNRPLFRLSQYTPFIGQCIKIRLHQPVENQRNFTGILEAIEENKAILLKINDENTRRFLFQDIAKANVISDFEDTHHDK
ncbi:MAG TPA: ribosome maturation factor RimP [Coxiellaceae bacterium]|nr:ribosome maturation factor RimP [Coxiellaceae bacterium]